MSRIDPPLTLSEATAIQGIFVEGLRVLDGLTFRFPMIGAANIGNVMYQVAIDDYPNRNLNLRENVVATIRCREWTLIIPAFAHHRSGKIDLTMIDASLQGGTREQLRHSLTLVAMFL